MKLFFLTFLITPFLANAANITGDCQIMDTQTSTTTVFKLIPVVPQEPENIVAKGASDEYTSYITANKTTDSLCVTFRIGNTGKDLFHSACSSYGYISMRKPLILYTALSTTKNVRCTATIQ